MFGILIACWNIFQKAIKLWPKTVEKLVLAAIALHNYLRQTDNASYTPSEFIDCKNGNGELYLDNKEIMWMAIPSKIYQKFEAQNTIKMWEELAHHLFRNGSVPWQMDYNQTNRARISQWYWQ